MYGGPPVSRHNRATPYPDDEPSGLLSDYRTADGLDTVDWSRRPTQIHPYRTTRPPVVPDELLVELLRLAQDARSFVLMLFQCVAIIAVFYAITLVSWGLWGTP
ncbi:MAG: hypothetical protein LC772_06815 [Chloroflexi bacterium]|nr:hypothetical protein [Chloroflexota bacterium]